ncbi:MAG: DUF1697 domain-containing protein [Bacteroidetes bacterium]|nr:DUF1697 domain-containing protein [Bacteroidota bacterium]
MERYIAMLRGINVSGQKIIKMEHLRSVFNDMKFKNVATYIQSGNVLFDSKETDEAELVQKIEKQIKKIYGWDVPTFVRTIPQLQSVIKNNPFKKIIPPEAVQPYVTFLHTEPTKEQKTMLEALSCDTDTFAVKGREVYTLLYKDKGKPLFTNMFLEKKLKMPGTGRNWLTVNKLTEL